MQALRSCLVFNLKNDTFADHGAHVELGIGVRNAQGEVFRKAYRADGAVARQ